MKKPKEGKKERYRARRNLLRGVYIGGKGKKNYREGGVSKNFYFNLSSSEEEIRKYKDGIGGGDVVRHPELGYALKVN